jgi:hypothetical protein
MVFDYRNGTYISQVAAESPEAAIINWATAAKEQDLSTWRITRAELANSPKMRRFRSKTA